MSDLTLVTWQSAVIAMLDELLYEAGLHPHDSFERETLLLERWRLQEMLDQVRDREPPQRGQVESLAVCRSVRDHLSISNELLGKIGDLFHFYRRNIQRLKWADSTPTTS